MGTRKFTGGRVLNNAIKEVLFKRKRLIEQNGIPAKQAVDIIKAAALLLIAEKCTEEETNEQR